VEWPFSFPRKPMSDIIRGAMEMAKKQLLDMMLWTFGIVAKLETELLAHQVAFLIVKTSGGCPELEQVLDHARKNPTPRLAMRQNERRDAIRRILEEDTPDQALMKFLRDWKPTGPAN